MTANDSPSKLKLLGATVLSFLVFVASIIITIEGVSFLTNTNGMFYKHRPVLKTSDCAIWDYSNDFEKRISFIKVAEVGKEYYKLNTFYAYKLNGDKYALGVYEDIERSSSTDRCYQKIDCKQGLITFLNAYDIKYKETDNKVGK